MLDILQTLCFKGIYICRLAALTTPNSGGEMDPKQFFLEPENIIQKQYEALRAFYTGELTAQEAAKKYGYKLSSFYSLSRDFKKKIRDGRSPTVFCDT